MADAIAVTCKKCGKSMKVPGKLAGKKVRCKACEAAVAVPEPVAKETFKIAEEPAQPKPPAPAKRPYDDDDDDGRKDYETLPDDYHIKRCAFCAAELDPPNARICKACGFDMYDRKRFESKSVYENTLGDYLNHHALTILAFLFIIALIVIDVIFFMNMDDWFQGSFMETDEKDPTTGKPKYYVGPGLVLTWATILFLAMSWYAGRFIYRKLRDFHPRETLTKE